MDKNKKYFFKLLSGYIHGTTVQYNDEIDWNIVFNIADKHSLSGIIYNMFQKQSNMVNISKSLIEKEQIDYWTKVQNSVNKDYEMKKIIKELSLKKIPHVLMKGYIIKNLYPDPDLRTMGDVDFLIKEEDMEKVDEILTTGLGYKYLKLYELLEIMAK